MSLTGLSIDDPGVQLSVQSHRIAKNADERRLPCHSLISRPGIESHSDRYDQKAARSQKGFQSSHD
jgi:hypothetical protein